MKRTLATLFLLASVTPFAVQAQWLTLDKPGIPRTPDGKPNLAAPAPRTADGHAELTGLWRSAGTSGDLRDTSKLQAWALTAMAAHEKNYYKDGPHMQCLPTGPAGFAGGMRRIVQSPTVIAVLNGDLTYRQIFTDGRELEPDPLPIFMGYSVGRWDGDTLVVDTTNFNGRAGVRGSGEQLHLVERFTRVDDTTLLYEFTVDDPTVFTKPWSAALPMTKSTDRIYEYACHEGNYALPNILRGAREDERRRQ